MIGYLQQLYDLYFEFTAPGDNNDLAAYLSMSLVVVRKPCLRRALPGFAWRGAKRTPGWFGNLAAKPAHANPQARTGVPPPLLAQTNKPLGQPVAKSDTMDLVFQFGSATQVGRRANTGTLACKCHTMPGWAVAAKNGRSSERGCQRGRCGVGRFPCANTTTPHHAAPNPTPRMR